MRRQKDNLILRSELAVSPPCGESGLSERLEGWATDKVLVPTLRDAKAAFAADAAKRRLRVAPQGEVSPEED